MPGERGPAFNQSDPLHGRSRAPRVQRAHSHGEMRVRLRWAAYAVPEGQERWDRRNLNSKRVTVCRDALLSWNRAA